MARFSAQTFRISLTVSLIPLAALVSACSSDDDPPPNPFAGFGIWEGILNQSSPSSESRPLFGLVSPEGLWLSVSYAPGANPATALPVDSAWGAVNGDGDSFAATAVTYDATDQQFGYNAGGSYGARQSLSASYFKFQQGSNQQPSESGTLSANYNLAFEDGASASRVTGTYSNSTISMTLTAAGNALGVSGGSTGDAQMGTVSSFCGALGFSDSRFNSYVGLLELDPSECPSGQDPDPNPDFQVLAYFLDTVDCPSQTHPNTLVIGLHNGVVSHYYHRLCRI